MINNFALLIRIDAWLKMLHHGRGVELRWANRPGRTVEELLHRYGIPTYDQRVHPRGGRSVRVPAAQGRWAEYLCKRAGLPLQTVIDAANRNVKPGPLPPDWGKPAPFTGFVGAVFRLLGARTEQRNGKPTKRTASTPAKRSTRRDPAPPRLGIIGRLLRRR